MIDTPRLYQLIKSSGLSLRSEASGAAAITTGSDGYVIIRAWLGRFPVERFELAGTLVGPSDCTERVARQLVLDANRLKDDMRAALALGSGGGETLAGEGSGE